MSNDVKRMVERAIAAFTALTLGVGISVASMLTPAVAHAFPTGNQVQSRAIYMSNSTPNATNVSYLVTYKPATTTTIKGIILDFCSGSPIIGDSTCGTPSGFTVGTPTVSTAAVISGANSPVTTTSMGGTWTAAALNSGRTLKLTNAAGSALTAGTLYGFVISTVTNPAQALPTTSGTFYARIITYTSDTGDIASYAPGNEGSTDAKDYGGFALSTAYNINITAKVQESLTFCASAIDLSDPTSTGTNNNCTFATNPILTLGHGTPSVLTNTAVDASSAYTQASTNASTGLGIRMHATNTCPNAGLSTNGGTTCNITGLDNTTAGAVTAGTTFFGLFVAPSTTTSLTPTSTGTVVPDANYYNAAHATTGTPASVWYGMDNTANSGVTSTYGDLIATSDPGSGGSGPLSQVNNQLMFAGTAGLTVPAGIYTGSESLIATGTF